MLHWLPLCLIALPLGPPPAAPRTPPAARTVTRVTLAPNAILTPLWRRPVVRTGIHRTLADSLSTPAISAGGARIVVGTGEGYVVGLRGNDGSVAWRRQVGVPLVSAATIIRVPASPGAGGLSAHHGDKDLELAILGVSDGSVLAIDVATGHKVWRVMLDFAVTAAPTPAGGRVVVTSESNQVVALDARTGRVLWTQARPARVGLTMQGHAQAVVQGDRVFTSFSDGFAVALSLATGDVLWSRPLSLRSGSFIDADATPQVGFGLVYVASLTDGVYALQQETGEAVWHHRAQDIVSLLLAGHVLYAGDTQGTLHALEPGNGTLRNRVHLGARPAGALMDLGDALVLTAGERGLLLVSPTTGKPLGHQSLGGLPGGELAMGHGLLVHMSRSGHVMLWQHNADVDVTAKPHAATSATTESPASVRHHNSAHGA